MYFEMKVNSLAEVFRTLLQTCVYSGLFLLSPTTVFSSLVYDSRSSYFALKPFYLMEGGPTTTKVFDLFSCQLLCQKEPNCFSINFARNPDDKGRHVCGFFDKPWNRGSLIRSEFFDFYTILYSRSCSHAKALGYHDSGNYIIDPDGYEGEAQPFWVYCNMTSHNGIGVTVVSHNSEARTKVSGCEDDGCYRRDVVYVGIYDMNQLRALTSISSHCEQFIKYECYDSVLFLDSRLTGYLVSRDGRQMKYWGGAPRDSRMCVCGVTGSCAKADAKCNCDANDPKWLEDSGFLTFKEDLPVTSLRFGDVFDESELGYHTLGKLVCYGL